MARITSRRRVLVGISSTAAIALSTSVIPSQARSIGRVRDRLIEAQHGTFNSAAMDQLLANAHEARSVGGVKGATIRFADRLMSDKFPDGSRAEVRGRDCSVLFFRYTNHGDNACAAWLSPCVRNDGCCDQLMSAFKGTEIVTFVEGPMNVAIQVMLQEFGDHLRSYQGFGVNKAKSRALEIIAPLDAKQTFWGTFESASGRDEYDSRFASVTIRYSGGGGSGEAVYTVRDKASNEVIFEDRATFPLLG